MKKGVLLVVTAAATLMLAVSTDLAAKFIADDLNPAAVWTMASVLALLTASAALGWGPFGTNHNREIVDLQRASDQLAAAVAAQWYGEAVTRGLTHPQPLKVRWHTTARPITAPLDVIAAGTVGGTVKSIRAAGDIDDLRDKFLQLPRRQLAIVGGPGAGKSVLAMTLTLRLLQSRSTGAPVPLLLSLSSWDATQERFADWIARRVSEDYPGLGAGSMNARVLAMQLFAAGKILPVLDGLDEMAPPHEAVISELNRAFGGDRPVIVTSRTEAFENALMQAPDPLAAALVVEIENISTSDVVHYLGYPHHGAGWTPLIDALTDEPDAELARAISTPLMAWLLVTAYGSGGQGSNELLDPGRFPTVDSVQNFLLDSMIPVVYDERAGQSEGPAARFPCSAQNAERWLGSLASLNRVRRGADSDRAASDIAWWALYVSLKRWEVAVTAFVFGGTLVSLPAFVIVGLTIGFGNGRGAIISATLAIGIVAGSIVAALFRPPPPGRVQLTLVPRRVDLVIVAARWPYAIMAGLTVGLAATTARLIQGWPLERSVVEGGRYGVLGAIAIFVVALLNGPVDTVRVVAAEAVLRADRSVASATALLTAAILMSVAIPVAGWEMGTAAALSSGLATAVGMSSWGWYQLARLWLALRRKLPFRLMAFLHDAYQRGVLRRAGSVFQFRHLRHQERLKERGAKTVGPKSRAM